MSKVLIVAGRELKERVTSRSFIWLSVFGPLLALGLIYFLFAMGGKTKTHWNVLITDKGNILDKKILAQENTAITYYFADDYIETDEFAHAKQFQKYDAMIEINEKVLSNKTGFVFYREEPSRKMQILFRYQVERRLEEVLVGQLTDLSVQKFREIKQPITFSFKNVYDPKEESTETEGWVGFVFGALIYIFIFLFGMTILRSITREKSNRIIEVLLATLRPTQLMLGKITGIGLSAFIQMFIWIVIIGAGLFFMRETLFPDIFDAANLNIVPDLSDQNYASRYFSQVEYNEFVELVYSRIKFGLMIPYFFLFFLFAYLFYGAFFIAIGASMGSESDGQQFVLPLILLFFFGLYGGYHAIFQSTDSLTSWLQYIPFTSPMVSMVRLSMGYGPSDIYMLYLSLFVLLISAIFMLLIADRIFTNGILQFGHRLRFNHFRRWIKKT